MSFVESFKEMAEKEDLQTALDRAESWKMTLEQMADDNDGEACIKDAIRVLGMEMNLVSQALDSMKNIARLETAPVGKELVISARATTGYDILNLKGALEVMESRKFSTSSVWSAQAFNWLEAYQCAQEHLDLLAGKSK